MVAAVTNLPRMGRLRRVAVDRRARTTAAAPSETWDALPSPRKEGKKCEIRWWLKWECTSVSDAILLERRLDLGQALRRNAVPDPIILIHQYLLHLLRLGVDPLCEDGYNLVLKLARLVGCCGFLEGLC